MEISSENLEKAKIYIKECDLIIDSGVSLKGINKGNFTLLKFAEEEGIEILSLRKEDIGIDLINHDSISSLIHYIKA